MNKMVWAKGAAFAALLLGSVCATSCRSHIDVAFDECLVRRRSACAAELASIQVEQRPTCCRCIARLALAQKQSALSNLQDKSPSELAHLLNRAAKDFERAAACAYDNREYAAEARATLQQYREIVSDEDPEHWLAVTSIANPHDRIDAVIKHATYHGGRCSHDVPGEYRGYISVLTSASTREIRGRLAAMSVTPLAKEVFRVYLAHRIEELPETIDRELKALEQMHLELYGTPYAAMVEETILSKASAVDDPSTADRLCHTLRSGDVRDKCLQRVQILLISAIGGAPARRLAEVCPLIESPETRAHCEVALAQEALKLITANATDVDLAFAKRTASVVGEKQIRETDLQLLRRDAERNFNRIVARQIEADLDLTESAGTWAKFIIVFDGLASSVSGSVDESLASIHPELDKKVRQRRQALLSEANEMYELDKNFCNGLANNNPQDNINALKYCISKMAAVLEKNESHANAKDLMNILEGKICASEVKREAGWTTVVVPLIFTEMLRAAIPASAANLIFRVWRATHY
ncbi:MAG TPA: hypothetical protein VFP80_05620 [Thermoanaerobaculia bacterium]|nr:hypothetical protein [Thermoanaerobaculia bacterium]